MKATLAMSAGLALGAGAAALAQQSVVNSPHNLSAGGPGQVRALSEDQVCIFCHAPHNASPIQPLWNRILPTTAYSVYASSALDAKPGQPTGASKMCLSCHDGTIALGSVVSRGQDIVMAGGVTTIPAGSGRIGTDLRDDHPVSFVYDGALSLRDPKLAPPSALPAQLRLDANRELQCTTCHEPHDNSRGNFLVMDNAASQLCKSCHQLLSTTIPAHEDCRSCHKTHTAPSGPFLLKGDRATTTCLTCHNGSVAGAPDIASDLSRFSVHDTNATIDQLDAIPNQVHCASCHEPHTMQQGSAVAPAIPPRFGDVAGVDSAGTPKSVATAQYEVCFRCHGDRNAITTPSVQRVITQTNTRLEFDLGAASFHPVEGPGRNPDVPSLLPGLTESSVIYCSDCHNSNRSAKAGGAGPSGVHGSDFPPLLIARYETADFTQESASAYALCYRCHERDGRDGILNDASFEEHKKHVEGEDAPCSACHDPHGISAFQGDPMRNAHLINFDRTIVFPDPVTGRLEFEELGRFQGRCFLRCHGENHSPKEYGN